jgi:outer membrane protein assembly factor BamD
MRRNKIFFFTLIISLSLSSSCYAFWVWTPQTKRWINPKYAVKTTPEKQFDYALSFYKRGNYKTAAGEFEKLINSYPGSLLAPEAGYYGGLSYQKAEEYYKAYLVYYKVLTQYPHSKRISQVVENKYEIGNIFLEGRRRKLMGVEILPALSTAEEIFKTIVDYAPYSEYGDKSWYKLGQIYKKTGRYKEAADAFAMIIKNYPNSALRNEAQYEIALCSLKESLPPAYEQESTDRTIEQFKEFIEERPPEDLTQEAEETIRELKERRAKHEYDIARFYEQNNKYKSAAIYYNSIIRDYPQTKWAQEARGRLEEIRKRQETNEK